MNDDDRRRAAQTILEVPFFHQLLDEFEASAVNACLNAAYHDHEGRQAHAKEASLVRKIRSRLEAISKEGQSTVSRKAPA